MSETSDTSLASLADAKPECLKYDATLFFNDFALPTYMVFPDESCIRYTPGLSGNFLIMLSALSRSMEPPVYMA
jgi:hypothetical protein